MTERTTDITRDLCDSQSQALYDDHAKGLRGYRWSLAAINQHNQVRENITERQKSGVFSSALWAEYGSDSSWYSFLPCRLRCPAETRSCRETSCISALT